MSVTDLYHKRKEAAERAGQTTILGYALPEGFRYQVVHLWNSVIGRPYWKSTPRQENLSRASTATEFKENYGGQSASDAIVELNGRFKEHDLGYEYNAGVIQRVDSQYLHAEVVEPALNLLYESGFQGPSEEFLSAHKHHREGSTKEGIREALNAFESTLKAICDARQWSYPKGAGANKLVDTVFIHGLIAPELRSHFDVLDKTLSAGLPVVRNEMGGHGQGAEVAEVPGYMAAYALHLAATNIVMLVEANKDFQSGS